MSSKNVTAVVEKISSSTAAEMLEGNTSNRNVSDYKVDEYAMAMKKGNFPFTGEPIQITKKGRLLNGQHRLLAIIKSGVTIELLVVRGVEEDTFKYMDTGKPRSASDVLSIEGIEYPSRIASIAKFAIKFKQGHLGIAANQNTGNGSNKLTNSEVSEFVNKNHQLLKVSMEYGYSSENNKVRILPGSLLGGLYFVFSKIDDDKASEFCTKLVNGINLGQNSPIRLLRQRLLQANKSKSKLAPYEKLALIIKAWNALRDGKPVSQIKWYTATESFPKPI